MELYKLEDYCINLKEMIYVDKASKFTNPIVPIGVKCSRQDVKFCIVKKNKSSGEEVMFSDMSLNEKGKNICYLFFKNKHMKQNMIDNLIDMFDSGVVFLRIFIPIGSCFKDIFDGALFEPIYARFKTSRVLVKGKKMGRVTKRDRLCFDGFVEISDLYLDSALYESVDDSHEENMIGSNGGNEGVKMEITKKHNEKLLSEITPLK